MNGDRYFKARFKIEMLNCGEKTWPSVAENLDGSNLGKKVAAWDSCLPTSLVKCHALRLFFWHLQQTNLQKYQHRANTTTCKLENILIHLSLRNVILNTERFD